MSSLLSKVCAATPLRRNVFGLVSLLPLGATLGACGPLSGTTQATEAMTQATEATTPTEATMTGGAKSTIWSRRFGAAGPDEGR